MLDDEVAEAFGLVADKRVAEAVFEIDLRRLGRDVAAERGALLEVILMHEGCGQGHRAAQ